MKKIRFLLILMISLSIVGCNNKEKSNDSILNDSVVAQDELQYPKDSIHDQIASFLSGEEYCNFNNNTEEGIPEYWQTYSDEVGPSWDDITETRLMPMQEWTTTTISPKINDTLNLFYPFSGPDFLHANYIFPDANNYTFIAMERLGSIPNLSDLSNQQIQDYVENSQTALRDIFKRSYFITMHMGEDLTKEDINGVIPIFYIFLHKTGFEIMDVDLVTINEDGSELIEIEELTNRFDATEGVRFMIRKIGETKIRQLVYFRADISDDGFVETPEFYNYLTAMGDVNSMIKSASYLSHYGTFSDIRNLVLGHSRAVFEDDTGIPYHYFKDNNDWDIHLYGEYEPPIADFNRNLHQSDLEEAYKAESVGELPFSLGYHWNSRKQNQMLYIKK